MSHNVRRLSLGGKSIVLVGTAHISRESVDEVERLVREESPGRVCVEIDAPRYASMTEQSSWERLNLGKVLKEGKGFLLMANLVLAGFQRRMGADVGVRPGDEMLAAVRAADSLGIPRSFCDRDVQATLRRAWGKSGLWNKCKLLASLVSSAFSSEKLDEGEIEKLKETGELEGMMAELAEYLPSVKEVLIDERDRYLASKIYASPEASVMAVVGAGHMAGVEHWLSSFESSPEALDVEGLEAIPLPSIAGKAAGWIIPIALVAIIALGFFRSGAEVSLGLMLKWILWNGSLAALGSLVCLAHPLTILVSFLSAPIATLNPFIGVGIFAGGAEAFLRKPTVKDFESLSEDASSIKGFYTNKVTRVLLIFFLSSLGGAIGNFVAIPVLLGAAL